MNEIEKKTVFAAGIPLWTPLGAYDAPKHSLVGWGAKPPTISPLTPLASRLSVPLVHHQSPQSSGQIDASAGRNGGPATGRSYISPICSPVEQFQ